MHLDSGDCALRDEQGTPPRKNPIGGLKGLLALCFFGGCEPFRLAAEEGHLVAQGPDLLCHIIHHHNLRLGHEPNEVRLLPEMGVEHGKRLDGHLRVAEVLRQSEHTLHELWRASGFLRKGHFGTDEGRREDFMLQRCE